jgi:hypothetical protein
MKTEIVESKSIKENKFPLIAKSIKNKVVVLFISPKEGTVLIQGDGAYEMGHFNDTFASCTLDHIWEILNEVTITFKS